MVESQSRYSIVDELIKEKNKKEEELTIIDQKTKQEEFDHIRAGEDLKLIKEQREKSKETLKQEIKNIDEGIQAIQSISKETPSK